MEPIFVRYSGDMPCEEGVSYKYKPIMDHQKILYRAIVNGLSTFGGMICTAPMGAGKTLIINVLSSCIQCKLGENVIEKIFIVVPTRMLIANIMSEFIEMATGKLPPPSEDINKLMLLNVPFGESIYIISDDDFVKQHNKDKSYDKTLIIIDEAHKIKPKKITKPRKTKTTNTDTKPKAKVSKTDEGPRIFESIQQARNSGAKVILFTATPITDYMSDLVDLYNLASGETLKVPNQNNIGVFLDRLSSITVHVPYGKLNNRHTYPNYNIVYQGVPLPGHNAEYYINAIAQPEMSRVKDPFRYKQQAILLQRPPMPNVTVTDLESNNGKGVKILRDILEFHRQEGRVVVFSRIVTEFLIPLRDKVKSLEIPTLLIDGSTSLQDTKSKDIDKSYGILSIMKRFNTHKSRPVLFVSIDSGGVGLSLQGGSHVIFCEPNYSYGTMEQAIARVVRSRHLFAGTPKIVQIYIYISMLPKGYYELAIVNNKTMGTTEEQCRRIKTADEQVYDVLMTKKNVVVPLRTRLAMASYANMINLSGDNSMAPSSILNDFNPAFVLDTIQLTNEPNIGTEADCRGKGNKIRKAPEIIEILDDDDDETKDEREIIEVF
jgi:hypothetical protein